MEPTSSPTSDRDERFLRGPARLLTALGAMVDGGAVGVAARGDRGHAARPPWPARLATG